MKQRVCAFLIGLLLAGTIASFPVPLSPTNSALSDQPAHRSDVVHGWLHTSGTLILDQNDHPVRFQGLNVGTMGPGSGTPIVNDTTCGDNWMWDYPTVQRSYDNVSNWGFNVVRLGFSWANLEPLSPTFVSQDNLSHHWNLPYLHAFDNIVANYTSRNIPVILVPAQYFWSPAFKNLQFSGRTFCQGGGMPTWLYPDAAQLQSTYGSLGAVGYAECAFLNDHAEPNVPVGPLTGFMEAWRFLVARYANNDLVIGADIINELYFLPHCRNYPGMTDYSLNQFYQTAGNTIRSVNPNLLLIVEGGGLNSQALETNLEGPFMSNTIYSFHFYPSNWNVTAYDYQVMFARKWNMPIWMGEFNYRIPDNGVQDPNWTSDTIAMLRTLENDGVGWCFWSLDNPVGITEHVPTGPPNYPTIFSTDLDTVHMLQSGFSSGSYSINVTETGLIVGTSWSVNLNGWTRNSSNDMINFEALNGTYNLTIQADHYSVSGVTPTILVLGRNVHLTPVFQSTNPPHLPGLPVPASPFTPLIGIVLVVGIAMVMAALLLSRLRGKKRSA